jgi:hypothetical protein
MPDFADRIREFRAAQLIEFTGEFVCDKAYTSRNPLDPQHAWHTAGGKLSLGRRG